MVQPPRLARSLFVAANRQHNHVGLLRHLHCLGNRLPVLHRIARHNLILIPRSANGDLATLAVEHLHLLANLRLDAVQHRDIVLRHAAVSAQQPAIRVRSNHSDGLDLAHVKRRKAVFVLQQRDRLMRCRQRQPAMLVTTNHALRLCRIDIRIVEQPHLKLPEQHRRNQLFQFLLLQHALLHQLYQVQVAIRIGQLDVDPGFHRKRARLLLVLGDKVPMRIRPVTKLPDRVVIRHNKPLEAPLFAQQVAHQPLVRVRRNAVDLVIRRHQRHGICLAQRLFEGVKKRLLQHPHRHVRRRAIHARLRLPVPHKMFQCRQHMLLVAEVLVSLEAPHRRNAQPRNQVRILAVRLFHAAPSRLARHIHHRGQRMVRTAQARLQSRHREQRLHKRGIESCAQSDGLRKAGATRSRVPVQALFVKHHWNSKAAILEKEFLYFVGQQGHAASVLAATGIAGPAHLAQPAAIPKRLLRLLQIEVALLIHQRLRLRLPHAQHLRGLFLQRHPRKQILHAPS